MNDDKVIIQLNIDSLTALVNGLYVQTHQTRVEAIPTSLFLEIAEKLSKYLPVWDYNKCSLEEWVASFLIILPKVMIQESELAYMRANNQIYCERWEGNVVLVASAPVVILNDGGVENGGQNVTV